MANYANLKAAIDNVIKTNGQKEITGEVLNQTLNAMVNSLGAGYQFAGVATPSTNPGTPDQNVFYFATQAGTYSNFSNIVLPDGISILVWNGSWSSSTFSYADGVFDISAYHATGGTLATYADLSAALGTSGANIPEPIRKGGMSVKFVQSSDNKYVQFRYMLDDVTTAAIFTNTANWSLSQDITLINSNEFRKVWRDKDGKIALAIRANGDIHFGSGVPTQVVEYVLSKLLGKADTSSVYTKIESDAKYVEKESGKSLINSLFAQAVSEIENPEWLKLYVDTNNKVVAGIRKDGSVVIKTKLLGLDETLAEIEKKLEIYANNLFAEAKNYTDESIQNPDVVVRNNDKLPSLVNACRKGMTNNSNSANKDAQFLIITDTHTVNQAVEDGVNAANGFGTIDFIVHCGDSVGGIFYGEENYVSQQFIPTMQSSGKPWFLCIGNHDVSTTRYVHWATNHEMMYNAFIKPVIESGNLVSGEYQTGKNYYYHDFANLKTRLIVMYEYDNPMESIDDLADSSVWQPVTYNASYPEMQPATLYTYDSGNDTILNIRDYTVCSFKLLKTVITPITYDDNNMGLIDSDYWDIVAYNSSYNKVQRSHTYEYDANNDTFVNCGNYTGHSFKLKATVTTPYYGYGNMPTFKIGRGLNMLRQVQAQWFLNTLASTPSGYGVVIATHIPMMLGVNQQDKMFAVKKAMPSQSNAFVMANDFLSEAVNAFVNRTNFSANIVLQSSGLAWGSDGSYLNTNAGSPNYYYNVSKDFSAAVGKFRCFIGGHWHMDLVLKHPTYNQWGIYPVCGRLTTYGEADLSNRSVGYDLAFDAITVVSCADNRLALVRIGNNRTFDGGLRDFEVINTSN